MARVHPTTSVRSDAIKKPPAHRHAADYFDSEFGLPPAIVAMSFDY